MSRVTGYLPICEASVVMAGKFLREESIQNLYSAKPADSFLMGGKKIDKEPESLRVFVCQLYTILFMCMG